MGRGGWSRWDSEVLWKVGREEVYQLAISGFTSKHDVQVVSNSDSFCAVGDEAVLGFVGEAGGCVAAGGRKLPEESGRLGDLDSRCV